MRVVKVKDLTPNMKLGKTLFDNKGKVLLHTNCTNLDKYINRLLELEINYVYINDELSEDIEVTQTISDETRIKSKNIIMNTMKNVALNREIDLTIIRHSVMEMIDDILSNKNILLDLTDIKTKDDYTFSHSVNVAVISLIIGKLLKYNQMQLANLGIGALLHDIGKSLIPLEVLNKTEKLTEPEFNLIKTHSQVGFNLVKDRYDISSMSRVAILSHHERIDGTGYPNKLKGDSIHEFAKIIAIADVFDALASDRIYRSKWPIYQVIEYLVSYSNTYFDYNIVKMFTSKVAAFPNGTKVTLSTGEVGIVKEQNEDFPTRPIVKIIRDKEGNSVFKIINLIKELSVVIVESE